MEFNITEIDVQIISFVLGGGLATIITLKQTRRKAELENNNIVEEGLRNWCHELQEDNKKLRESERDLQHIVNEKDCQNGRLSHQLTIAQYACEQNVALKCHKLYCKLREPKLDEQYIQDTINMTVDTEGDDEKEERKAMAEFEKTYEQPKQDNV